MSAEAVSYVYRFSPFSGAAFAIHLAIADSVNDQHEHRFWMASTTLATKARCRRSTAAQALATLRDEGFIEVLEEGRGKPVEYRFLFPRMPVVYDTRRGVRKSDTPVGDEVAAQQTGGVRPADTRVSGDRTQTQETTQEPKKRARKRASSQQIAPTADFEMTPEHRAYCTKHGLDAEAEREHWIVDCEAKGRKYDVLNAGFATWLRQAVNFGRGAKQRPALALVPEPARPLLGEWRCVLGLGCSHGNIELEDRSVVRCACDGRLVAGGTR